MGNGNYTVQFKHDVVAQIAERGYPIKEVSKRLGVSLHAFCAWKGTFAKATAGDPEKDAKIRRVKRELARVPEERDILKDGHGPVPACARYKKPELFSVA